MYQGAPLRAAPNDEAITTATWYVTKAPSYVTMDIESTA